MTTAAAVRPDAWLPAARLCHGPSCLQARRKGPLGSAPSRWLGRPAGQPLEALRQGTPASKIYYILCLIALATQRIVAVRSPGKDYFIHITHLVKGPKKQPLVKKLPIRPRLINRLSTTLSTALSQRKINRASVAELRQTGPGLSCKTAPRRNNAHRHLLKFQAQLLPIRSVRLGSGRLPRCSIDWVSRHFGRRTDAAARSRLRG